MRKTLFASLLLLTSIHAHGHSGPAVPEPMTLDAMMAAFNWDFDTAEKKKKKVTDDLYVLFNDSVAKYPLDYIDSGSIQVVENTL